GGGVGEGGQEEVGGEVHERQEGDERGTEPQETAGVEPAETDVAGRLPFLEEDRRDEQPAQHEEHVDAEEPAREALVVVEDDGGDRERAEAVERRTVPEPGGSGRRGGGHCAEGSRSGERRACCDNAWPERRTATRLRRESAIPVEDRDRPGGDMLVTHPNAVARRSLAVAVWTCGLLGVSALSARSATWPDRVGTAEV